MEPPPKKRCPHSTTAPELTLGAPRTQAASGRYVTKGGVTVDRLVQPLSDPSDALEGLIDQLDQERGCVFQSSYEVPGRYARWTMGFVNPPLAFEAWGRRFSISALNKRGSVLLPAILAALQGIPALASLKADGDAALHGTVKEVETFFTEEERSRQHSIFSVVRALIDLFGYELEVQLGLYGAFGYDLTFQFETVALTQRRDATQRDLVLYLPDEIMVIDVLANASWRLSYDFSAAGQSTAGLPRTGATLAFAPLPAEQLPRRRDHGPGDFARKVELAKEQFRLGNLFECVLSQTFTEPCPQPPSEVFRRLRKRNPSPYGFLLNLGDTEFLVGASPEMFVRVEHNDKGWRCETCPISGTIRRGRDALEDAENIKQILSDKKEESELTMCTDVDRNDKSRICKAGSVQVIGRRQIEMYSRLIHTVDHVEGYLREGFDGLDAFLGHTWAVTVTGAPKPWAIKFVEEHEETPRCWYGGAVGMLGFDGHVNTGLTLRTVRLHRGAAEVRAGATLLFDSDPDSESRETELKASAMRDAVLRADTEPLVMVGGVVPSAVAPAAEADAALRRVVLVDHQDSFVHTLANYLRQTGALVTTIRFGFQEEELARLKPDLLVLSPGPGNPKDFNLSRTIDIALRRKLPIVGVCLGLQGMVEHYGGELGVLPYPQHGKPGSVVLREPRGALFAGSSAVEFPSEFQVGRYHSLYSLKAKHPKELRVTAETEDGIIMAIQHVSLPMAEIGRAHV